MEINSELSLNYHPTKSIIETQINSNFNFEKNEVLEAQGGLTGISQNLSSQLSTPINFLA